MQNIQNLLNQVKIINQKNNEILDATGGRFNIFKVCGVNHYENTHSAILAEFLNPNGSHGLKHQFLQAFIEILGKDFTLESFNVEKANVKTEHATSEGRIDIFIEDDENNVIIIENKIYAGDQWEQLKRYDNFAQNHTNYTEEIPKKYQIFYLTLFGEKASEQSAGDIEYQCISYEKIIIEWLEKCLHISTRYPMVRETIAQYINHLKTLTNQDMDTKNQQEIAKILANDLESAQAIYQNYQATFDFIVKKYFNEKMEEFVKNEVSKYGLEYHYEQSWDTLIKFYLKSPKWENKYWIGFSYEGNKYLYGLVNNPNVYKIPAEKRAELHQNLKKLGISDFKESEWWACYKHIPNLTIENWQDLSPFINDCKTRIKDILKAMEGIDF